MLDALDRNGYKSSHFFHRLFRKVLLPKAREEVVIPTLYGFSIQVNPGKGHLLEDKLYTYGTYEKGMLEILPYLLPKSGVFVDAGANIGMMSLFAATTVGKHGKVISFEPHPETYKALQKNIHLNNWGDIIHAFQLGLGNEKVTLQMEMAEGDRGMAKVSKNKGAVTIEVEKLSDLLMDNFPEIIVDVIKIDVEGFEMEVLKGAHTIFLGKNPPVIIVECSEERDNFNYSREELFRTIKTLPGYRIFKLSNGKEKVGHFVEILDEQSLPIHDNIFGIPESRLSGLPQSKFSKA